MATETMNYRMTTSVHLPYDRAAVDPEASLSRVGSEELRPLAEDVKARLRRVLDVVGSATP